MVLVMVCVLQGIEELSPGAAPRDPHEPTEFLWPTPAKVGFRGFWSSLGTVCPHHCCPTSGRTTLHPLAFASLPVGVLPPPVGQHKVCMAEDGREAQGL